MGGTLGSGVSIRETLKRVACDLIPLKTLVRPEEDAVKYLDLVTSDSLVTLAGIERMC